MQNQKDNKKGVKWIFSYSRCSLIRLKSISFLPVRLSPCCFRYTLHWSIFNLSNLPSTVILMDTLQKFKKCEKQINFMVQQKCKTINKNLCKMMFKSGQVGSLSHTQTPTPVSGLGQPDPLLVRLVRYCSGALAYLL